MMVDVEVKQARFKTRHCDYTDLFIDVLSEKEHDKGLSWVIRDTKPGAVRTIEVIVEKPGGDFIEAEVNAMARVSDMKEDLVDVVEVPASKMCFKYKGRPMEDRKCVYEYEFPKKPVIQLIEKRDVQFSVRVPGGDIVRLTMCRTSLVSNVLLEVMRGRKFHEKNMRLWHKGAIMGALTMIKDYELGEGSDEVLQLAPGRNPLSLELRSFTRWTMSLDVDADDCVQDVKYLVSKRRQKMPMDKQILIYEGATLKDDQPLSEYNIQNNDTLNVRLLVHGEGPPLHILTSTGQYLPFPVFKFDLTSDVNERITNQLGIPQEDQQFMILNDHVMGADIKKAFRVDWSTWCRVI